MAPRRGDPQPSDPERPIDRRTLLKGGLLAAGALAGGGAVLGDLLAKQAEDSSSRQAAHRSRHPHRTPAGGDPGAGERRPRAPGAYKRAPNILVIVVDQLRTPCWFSAAPAATRLMPNLAGIRDGGVSFDSHYTASNDCTPARATLLTGLYTHQTGCMITGGSTLNPGFPTWGSMLREQGYGTWWYGKWHLTHRDNHWSLPADEGALEPYGFAGGTYPSPDGGPGQGWTTDPYIAAQFQEWVATAPSQQPWCTTVSFVNPHDIAWWYHWSDRFAAEASAPSRVRRLPPNFQTPLQLERARKPRLQLSHQETTSLSFGRVPFSGPQTLESWAPFFDLYLKLLHEVDRQIGVVLSALHSRPDLAENTVVIFTSDHGEYGGSHGLRGKGGAVYEEGIRVPLIVKDLRGGDALTAAPRHRRTGLTSSVDVAPLLLSIATGSDSWRRDSHYGHIAGRHDLASMLADPRAPGRGHVLHASDEIVTEFALAPYAADAPLHLAAIRTEQGKLAHYSNWREGTTEASREGQEVELYDYSTREGRLELDNRAELASPLLSRLSAKLQRAVAQELREPLPSHLQPVQRDGIADYFDTAARAAVKASRRRELMLERELRGRLPGGGLRRMLRRQHRGVGAGG
jgi:arylsulfatase A-like enzyme